MVKEVADCILHRWETLLGDIKQLPLIDDKQIFNKIKRIYEKGIDYLTMDVVKRYKSTSFIEFRNNLEHLFDICSCSCLLISCEKSRPPCRSKNCYRFHIDCICAIKIPKRGIQFLIDQRGSRLMRISPIDAGLSRKFKTQSRTKIAQKIILEN